MSLVTSISANFGQFSNLTVNSLTFAPSVTQAALVIQVARPPELATYNIVPLSVMQAAFPHIQITSYFVTPTDTLQSVEAVVDAYFAAHPFAAREVLLNLGTPELYAYGLNLVALPKYSDVVFLNLVSTVDAVRSNTNRNLYFGLTADSFFLPIIFFRFRIGVNNSLVLLTSDEPGDPTPYINSVIAASQIALPPPFVPVQHFTLSQMSSLAAQNAMTNATHIFICSQTGQQSIASLIPQAFTKTVIFVGLAPVNQTVVNTLARCFADVTYATPCSLPMLNSTNEWYNAVRDSFASAPNPNLTAFYSLLNSVGQWRELWCDTEIMSRKVMAVTGVLVDIVNTPT
jgi:hypothetical protein